MSAPQAVPPTVHRLLERLGEAGIFRDFYLAGGTGLALLLSHRRSVDLDLFSRGNRLKAEERRALIARLKPVSRWTLVEEKEGTLHGRLGGVKVSFFRYPQPLVRPLARRGAVRIASLEDIGLMKIGAIVGRGSKKDFVDLYEICRRIPLDELLRLGARKFPDSRDFTLQALKGLSFFREAEEEPPVISVKPASWEKVREFFSRQVSLLGRRTLRTRRQD
ncbi:MAG: nucleotidyl transferase AbiEii/AbiGii toxin family protein [Candidatus Omnitrophica bacterium]|nr:nucleotidyl transferase AbiEii/AbiGii toxin family protein [Candidatus Omnitrophota bacterium]